MVWEKGTHLLEAAVWLFYSRGVGTRGISRFVQAVGGRRLRRDNAVASKENRVLDVLDARYGRVLERRDRAAARAWPVWDHARLG